MESRSIAVHHDRRSRRRWRTAAVLVVPIAAVLIVLGYGLGLLASLGPTPLPARPAPVFTLPLFDGQELRLEDLRGTVVVLNFWASWCSPCRTEAPAMEAAWRAYRDRGVVFIGANIQDREPQAHAFLEEFGITYPNGVDREGRIALDYGLWALPETVIIDREGRITYRYIGAVRLPSLMTRLDEALQGSPRGIESREIDTERARGAQ